MLKDIPTIADKPKAKPTAVSNFQTRDNMAERTILFDIFNHGVDMEDLQYFRKCYEKMLATDDVVCHATLLFKELSALLVAVYQSKLLQYPSIVYMNVLLVC